MKRVILLSVSILLISLAYSFAEVPCKINYQGRLIENNVPVDGTKTMKFTIYNSAVGGDELWTSGNVDITVYNGLFRYVLGEGSIDGSPVDDLSSLDWTAGQELYLQVIVDGEPLTPLEAIYAYPYAINSHLLEGVTKEYFINTSGDTQTKRGNLKIEGILDINAPDTDIDALRVHSGDTYGLYVSTGGNVGIGTTDPGEKLTVTGTIESTTGGVKFPDGTLQTTAPSAPTIEVINANTNTKYTRNHTGFVKIECFYNGYQAAAANAVVKFNVDEQTVKSYNKQQNYYTFPSLIAVYYAEKSGNFTFSCDTSAVTTLNLQFVITEY